MISRWRHPLSISLRLARALHSSTLWRVKRLHPFLLADIGEGITECEVLKWSVKPNSSIGAFDPLCEVQSDKASVEITSPFDGVVKQILVQEGEIAKVGQGLCTIEVEEEDEQVPADLNVANSTVGSSGEPLDLSIEAPSISNADSTPSPAEEGEDSITRPRRPHPLDPSYQDSTSPRSSSTPKASHSTTKFAPAKNTLAAPSVRRFARANGIDDLSVVGLGSGKRGRIEIGDVEAYLGRIEPSPSANTRTVASADEVQVIELGRTRWAMFKAMTKSLEIPHFGYSTTLDLTSLVNILPTLNAHIPRTLDASPLASQSTAVSPHSIFSASSSEPAAELSLDTSRQYKRLTILPLLIKALSRAMMEWPLFRTSLNPPRTGTTLTSSTPTSSPEKPTLTLRPHADISLALSTPTGLYTPTITAVDLTSAYEIAGEIRRLSDLGRRVPSGLTAKEMPKSGGTVSVSNVGAIGKGEWAAPVLVPGSGVAIVAVGHAKWVMRLPSDGIGEPQRRFVVGVSWSADHRVVEGAELAAFVESWRGWVEHPERMIADGR